MAFKTAEGLAQHAEEVFAEKWLYAWGTVGQRLADVYSSLARGSYYRDKNPGGLIKLKAILDGGSNPQVVDCHGIVDGFHMEVGEIITFDPLLDSTANTDFYAVKNSGTQGVDWGLIGTLPKDNQRGLGVWKDGHFGVCVGNDMVIDIYSTANPARRVHVSKVSWTHWFKCRKIDYGGKVSTMLRNGSIGSAVLALQLDLNKLAYGLKADGEFGDNTETAVRAFQTKFGLTVDGLVGDQTLAAIASAIKPPVPVVVPEIDYKPILDAANAQITALELEVTRATALFEGYASNNFVLNKKLEDIKFAATVLRSLFI